MLVQRFSTWGSRTPGGSRKGARGFARSKLIMADTKILAHFCKTKMKKYESFTVLVSKQLTEDFVLITV